MVAMTEEEAPAMAAESVSVADIEAVNAYVSVSPLATTEADAAVADALAAVGVDEIAKLRNPDQATYDPPPP